MILTLSLEPRQSTCEKVSLPQSRRHAQDRRGRRTRRKDTLNLISDVDTGDLGIYHDRTRYAKLTQIINLKQKSKDHTDERSSVKKRKHKKNTNDWNEYYKYDQWPVDIVDYTWQGDDNEEFDIALPYERRQSFRSAKRFVANYVFVSS